MANADYEIKEQIDDQVIPALEYNSVLQLFPMIQLGEGIQRWTRRIATEPKEPEIQAEIVKIYTDKFKLENGEYALPRAHERIVMTEDQYKSLVRAGAMPANLQTLGIAMAKAVDKKMIFQNPPTAGAGSELNTKFYGLTDAGTGNGTYSRPLQCDAGTTAGKWDVANKAMTDAGALEAAIHQFVEFSGPLACFYPSNCLGAFNMPNLVTGAVDGYVMDMFKRFFTMIPVGQDADSNSLMTGGSEAVTDFQIYACNPLKFAFVYDQPPSTELWHDKSTKTWNYDIEVHGALVPTVFSESGGKIYKASAEIDGLDWVT